jgi:hypothetical protein
MLNPISSAILVQVAAKCNVPKRRKWAHPTLLGTPPAGG